MIPQISDYKNYSLKILIITAIAFILQQIIPYFESIFILNSSYILSRPWMFLTSMFLHGSLMHIFFNMFALMIFGPMIEQRIGSRRFLFVYIIGGIFANIIGVFFYPQSLGASGAIMAMLGTLVILMPHLRVFIYGLVPIPLWMAGIAWFLLDLFGSFSGTRGIGHIVHIVGLLFGLIFGLYLRNKTQKISFKNIKPGKSMNKSNNVDEWIRRNS
ncbi:MAG: rhomboid family intramembrane serine protease [Nanoarchaeota archaeon]|nr:rhomboid family intramembrane serine protease [Nanoarchaeota archaeon]